GNLGKSSGKTSGNSRTIDTSSSRFSSDLSSAFLDVTCARFGYIKNHKKIVKNGQTRTRETEEHKRGQRFKAKARKRQKVKVVVNLQSTLGQ
ncbi:hypothetical protein Tco_1579463, partial [Tanacetum coccineum]